MMIIMQDKWAPEEWIAQTTGLWFCFALVIAAAIGTLAVSTAMRLAEVSAISPFRYVRVVFGIGAGIFILGEQVDAPTIIGCVIVVAAGLYGWFRERRIANPAISPLR